MKLSDLRNAMLYWVNALPAGSADNLKFANSLDPGQARQNIRPDLDPTCLTLGWHS